MNNEQQALSPWLEPVEAKIQACGGRGGFFVAMPQYRPDLIQQMAAALDLDFFDFRAEVLLPLGWEAGQLGLEALDDEIAMRSNAHGLVVHNAEALLAAKDEAARRAWLQTFVTRDWPHPVVIPVVIFQGDLPLQAQRFHRFDPDTLPNETLLARLATR